MRNKRPDLDLSKVREEFKKKNDPIENGEIDRDTQRAMSMAAKLIEGSEQFVITEEDEGSVFLEASNLPSDEEIEAMKQDLAEQDKIELERFVNSLPWWKKFLLKIGLVKYEQRI